MSFKNPFKTLERMLLFITSVLAVITIALTFIGLFKLRNVVLGFDFSPQGWELFSNLLYDSIRIVRIDPPIFESTNTWLSAARIVAVAFVIVGVSTIILELSQPARDYFRKIYFQWFLSNPVLIIGAGRIGQPLALELRAEGKPVYVITHQSEPDIVKKLRQNNVLVIEGNAAAKDTLDSVPLLVMKEIFIATGDDALNLEVAANIKRQMHEKDESSKEPSCACHVHISEAGLTYSINNHKLFEEHKKNIKFYFFSSPGITAREFFSDLFLDQNIGLLSNSPAEEDSTSEPSNDSAKRFAIPKDKYEEAFHLFIFGFGEIGKALALGTARYAHFKSRLRPRITIFVDQKDGDSEWKAFLDRYTNFSPPDLDLTSTEIQDRWCAPDVSLPEDVDQFDVSNQEELIAKLQPHAIGYAVNAEFKPIITDVESEHVIGSIYERLKSNKPDIKAAVAFCYDDERRNFDQALRLQYELSRHLITEDPGKNCKVKCAASFSEKQLPVPIYAHLPVDIGLANLIKSDLVETGDDKTIDCTNRVFPVHTFGSQESIYSYDVIKNSGIKNYADSLEEAYQSASSNFSKHPDFEDSNMIAVMLSEIKLDALDIYFSDKFSDKKEGLGAIFNEYYESESIKEQLKEISKYKEENLDETNISKWIIRVKELLGRISKKYGKENLDNTNISRWIIPVKEIIKNRKENTENGHRYNIYDRLLFLDRIITEEEYDIKIFIKKIKLDVTKKKWFTRDKKNTASVADNLKENLEQSGIIDDLEYINEKNAEVLKFMKKKLKNLGIVNDLEYEESVIVLEGSLKLKDDAAAITLLIELIPNISGNLKEDIGDLVEGVNGSIAKLLKKYGDDSDVVSDSQLEKILSELEAKSESSEQHSRIELLIDLIQKTSGKLKEETGDLVEEVDKNIAKLLKSYGDDMDMVSDSEFEKIRFELEDNFESGDQHSRIKLLAKLVQSLTGKLKDQIQLLTTEVNKSVDTYAKDRQVDLNIGSDSKPEELVSQFLKKVKFQNQHSRIKLLFNLIRYITCKLEDFSGKSSTGENLTDIIVSLGKYHKNMGIDGNSEFEKTVSKLKKKHKPLDKASTIKYIDELSDFVYDKLEKKLKDSSNDATKKIINVFESHLEKHKIDADIAAEIEHNRWMGERLAKNWSFGKRDNFRKKRITFVPWELIAPTKKIVELKGFPHTDTRLEHRRRIIKMIKDTSIEGKEYGITKGYGFPKNFQADDYRLYDRQMLPKIIMDQRERGQEEIENDKSKNGNSKRLMYAYVRNNKEKQSSAS